MPLLDGCYLKFKRSLDHLHALNEARAVIFEDGEDRFRFTITGKLDSHGTKLLFEVVEVQEIPILQWGIMIGDAVHCVRSALDQLVFATARDPTRICAFPICRTEKEWTIESPGMLWSVPENVRALIDAAQPYKRGDAADSHPLAILGALSNLDKHRTIPTTSLKPVEVNAIITSMEGVASHGKLRLNGCALKSGAVIADMRIKRDLTAPSPHMEMDAHFLFEVAFGEAPVPSAIRNKEVVKTFNKTFGSYAFSVLRNASSILEPNVSRPSDMEFGVPGL